MGYYQQNKDLLECETGCGLSYNQVLDIADVEESSGIEPVFVEPVTLTEVKNFIKVDVDEDDDLIEMLISAARKECEDLSNIGFIKRMIAVVQNNCNGGAFLPLGPVGEIVIVSDEDGNEVTTDSYRISGSKWKQLLTPKSERITLTYYAGYAILPADLKRCLLECIFFHYDERKVRENAFPPIYLESIKRFARIW